MMVDIKNKTKQTNEQKTLSNLPEEIPDYKVSVNIPIDMPESINFNSIY